ncbi:MAG: hypothetical protein AAFN94_11555 [Pseudomonadota bacterium]
MDADSKLQHKINKSYVRIVVTYFVVFAYTVSAVGITIYLFTQGENELALSVFNGLATLSAGIAGFWFGSRGSGFPDADGAGDTARTDTTQTDDDILIGPEIGRDKPENRPEIGDDELSPPLEKD